MHLTVREVYIHQTENHMLWFNHVMNERERTMRLSIWLAVVTLGFCLNASEPTWAAGPPDRQATTEATGPRAPSHAGTPPERIALISNGAVKSFRTVRPELFKLIACTRDVYDKIWRLNAKCQKKCEEKRLGGLLWGRDIQACRVNCDNASYRSEYDASC